jgi:uncharacterized membrane protein YfcA
MHPFRIGATYGIGGIIANFALIQLNGKALDKNGLVGFAASFLVPLVIVYLSGHWAGRHERLRLNTSLTSGLLSTWHGTVAGFLSGLIYMILLGVTYNKVPQDIFYIPTSDWATTSLYVAGLIGWPIGGAVIGTIGGMLGDSLARKQIQKQEATVKAE